ncbi:MAG: protein translocase subunit SecD [Patescibacteria group bacterium]
MSTEYAKIRSKIRWGITGIFCLFLVSLIFIYPQKFNSFINKINETTHFGIPNIPEKNFRLGLDLQGGAHLVYEANVSNIEDNEKATSVEGVRDVIERRVNGMGVSEPQVQTTKVGDSYRLIVELPGVVNVEDAIDMIGETPILEFKEANDTPTRELTTEEKKEMNDYNTDAKKRATDILNKVKNGGDFSALAAEYSEDSVSKNNGGYVGFVPDNNAVTDIYNWAKQSSEGQFSSTLVDSVDGLNILKRGTERDGEKQVNVSHILICFLGATGCDNAIYNKSEAKAKAEEIYNSANADNFASLAKDNSSDTINGANGGDLGWITINQVPENFGNAVFSAGKGEIIGPVETEYGYHIIYKKDEKVGKEYEIYRILVATKDESDIVPPQEEWKNTGLSGKQLDHSEVVSDPQTGSIQVSLSFDDEGKELFSAITKKNLGKPVAIFLDGEAISIPTVQSVISDGRAVISGNFNIQEAKLLSQRLNSGALPVSIELVSQQTVGATLGSKSVEKSLYAGFIGVILVMLFMVIYYRLPGVLAALALSIYITVTLSIFKLIGVTLTLSGIAGFILSIGMAVDANVLIFERLKEELKNGKSLKTGIEEGFNRAWTSIRDSNVSTLLTCVILIGFGTSFVQGFAITLTIGILMSMFSAITITRVMLRFIAPWFKKRDGGVLFLGSSNHKE